MPSTMLRAAHELEVRDPVVGLVFVPVVNALGLARCWIASGEPHDVVLVRVAIWIGERVIASDADLDVTARGNDPAGVPVSVARAAGVIATAGLSSLFTRSHLIRTLRCAGRFDRERPNPLLRRLGLVGSLCLLPARGPVEAYAYCAWVLSYRGSKSPWWRS